MPLSNVLAVVIFGLVAFSLISWSFVRLWRDWRTDEIKNECEETPTWTPDPDMAALLCMEYPNEQREIQAFANALIGWSGIDYHQHEHLILVHYNRIMGNPELLEEGTYSFREALEQADRDFRKYCAEEDCA